MLQEKKILVGSDPLSDLWGDDITKPQYAAVLSAIEGMMFHTGIARLVFYNPHDALYDLVVNAFSLKRTFNNIPSVERRYATSVGDEEDLFEDIYLAYLFIRDDVKNGVSNPRGLYDRLPESYHIKHNSIIMYEYTWQINQEFCKVCPNLHDTVDVKSAQCNRFGFS